ncbi:MAG: nicotinamide mononucleotide transporter [Clostridia bacterium]|nr:nicotinamide mononucleotide transporter [Clostridia bacterium]
MSIVKSFKNLSPFEFWLWICSVIVIFCCFIFGNNFNLLTLIASLIGVTALIFVAKGDVIGQVLTVVFSIVYAIISFKFRYYGEMITYLGMTTPMAVLAVISWIRNPFSEKQVKVAKLKKGQVIIMLILAVVVTAAFYFILKYFNNANLFISTLSITTSFLASYLTYCRSSFYGLAYAANDVVLIILWILASVKDISYLPMVICFVIFFINDMYGFFNWQRMQKNQTKAS